MIKIVDWDKNFENAQSRRFATTKWVAMPNKRGFGYTKILKQKNGESIFGAWCALVELASTCSPRGELQSNGTEYSIDDISELTHFSVKTLNEMITFCCNILKWITIDQSNTAVLPESYSGIMTTPVVIPIFPIQSSSIQFSYAFESQEFKNAYDEWMKYRKERKKALVETTIKKQMIKLAKMGEQRAIAAIEFSIEKGYEGIYEEKQNGGQNKAYGKSGGNIDENHRHQYFPDSN